MSTVACELDEDRYADPNSVKVVCDQAMNAIYFSRAPIPYRRTHRDSLRPDVSVFHHLGLYAFKASFLRDFCRLTPTPLERCEGLEQLRAIEHGHKIRVSLVERMIHEVNVPEDLQRANDLLAHCEQGGSM